MNIQTKLKFSITLLNLNLGRSVLDPFRSDSCDAGYCLDAPEFIVSGSTLGRKQIGACGYACASTTVREGTF